MAELPTNKVLVLDIETSSTNTEVARLRCFGAYSYRNNKRYYIKGDTAAPLNQIQELIDNHDVLVGFNIKRFDLPVLQRQGIVVQYKTVVDLWEVISEPRLDPKTRVRHGGKGRGAYMGLTLNSWKLGNIVKALQLGEYKEEGFDYSVFQKEPSQWTEAEEKKIKEYLTQDITITKRLFEYTHNFFWGLAELLSEKNKLKFAYITSSIASLAYKIICHEAGLEETYGDGEKDFDYEGGYVRHPTKERHVGNIIAFDFRSLYPSIMRGFNLFSPAPPDAPESMVFTGNELFAIKGRYYKHEQGRVEKVVESLFKRRIEFKKKGDKREYLIKIIINSLYGITPKPTFAQVYSRHGGEDCTYIGRTMIQYVADQFNANGYEVLYGDTDSVYVALNNHTRDEAIKFADNLTSYLKSQMPFPHEDFGLALDAEIDAIFFFPMGDGTYKKKNYIYITKEGKLKIKGLPIIKSNASRIATKILNDHLRAQILKKKEIKFHPDYLKQLIYYELEQDLGLATQVYKVKSAEEYSNDTALHAQIASKYGAGTVELIPNKTFGIGKGKKYCSTQEFKDNRLRVQDIDLSVTWNNLEPFTAEPQKTLGDY